VRGACHAAASRQAVHVLASPVRRLAAALHRALATICAYDEGPEGSARFKGLTGTPLMIIKTLAELQEPDEASLLYSPMGLGAKMRPQDAADFQQRVIAQYALSSQVPESTRKSFERVQTIFSYGVLCYELYTVAGDHARLVIEQALRDRFLPFYDGIVNFVDGQGHPQVVNASDFDELYKAIRRDDGRLRGWKLQLVSGRKPFAFSGELTSLLRWARAEGLLDGQQDRVLDRPRVELRNVVAHPGYHLGTPVEAAEDVADLARIINRLWAASSGAPAPREVVALGWDQRTVRWGLAAGYHPGPLDEAAVFVLVRADPEDDLGSYDARYETTQQPCEYLWGPGSWPDAQAWLEREQPAGRDARPAVHAAVPRQDPLYAAGHPGGGWASRRRPRWHVVPDPR
jgi:hypothetical protein